MYHRSLMIDMEIWCCHDHGFISLIIGLVTFWMLVSCTSIFVSCWNPLAVSRATSLGEHMIHLTNGFKMLFLHNQFYVLVQLYDLYKVLRMCINYCLRIFHLCLVGYCLSTIHPLIHYHQAYLPIYWHLATGSVYVCGHELHCPVATSCTSFGKGWGSTAK